VLAKLRVAGRSSDALTRAAATAVHALAAARALRSKDIHPPSVFPQTVAARLGEPVKLTYVVLEDSEWSKEVVQVVVGGTEAKVIRTPLRRATYGKPHSVTWTVPASPGMKYCVIASDAAGNSSASTCGTIKLVA
jgi:hypothetical protein